MRRFRKARTAGNNLREHNDCSVIAASILCRVTYAKAHEACRQQGRKDRKGVYTHQLLNAIQSLGCKVEHYKPYGKELRQPSGSKYTAKTIGKRLTKGYYLCVVNGHFFSVVNGDVEDWTRDTKTQVRKVYKITRPRK